MGRKSSKSKDEMNAFQIAREECNMSREKASEIMEFVTVDRIERIEDNKSEPRPEEVLAMSKAYNKYELCNYYCSRVCPIGIEVVPEVKINTLTQITINMLDTLNQLNKQRERLIEISSDEAVTEDELPDFAKIMKNLQRISMTADALNIWINSKINSGLINGDSLKKLENK